VITTYTKVSYLQEPSDNQSLYTLMLIIGVIYPTLYEWS
jgi:hypothetical protein